MKIQKIAINDFPELLTLWNTVGLGVSNKKREEQEFKALIQWNPDSCFKVVKNKTIIGSIIGAFNGRRSWIYHLAIHPNFQKNGLGSKLVKKLEDKLKHKGATKIILGVSMTNLSVVPFYEKHGFKVMNDAVLMAKDLWKEESI